MTPFRVIVDQRITLYCGTVLEIGTVITVKDIIRVYTGDVYLHTLSECRCSRKDRTHGILERHTRPLHPLLQLAEQSE